MYINLKKIEITTSEINRRIEKLSSSLANHLFIVSYVPFNHDKHTMTPHIWVFGKNIDEVLGKAIKILSENGFHAQSIESIVELDSVDKEIFNQSCLSEN